MFFLALSFSDNSTFEGFNRISFQKKKKGFNRIKRGITPIFGLAYALTPTNLEGPISPPENSN